MKPAKLFALVGFLYLLWGSLGFGAEVGKAIIKGTVTVNGRPTSDAVVSLEGVLQSLPNSKAAAAVMDQRDMKFIPRVLPVRAGTTVNFPNNDKTFHNVFSTSEAKKFDLGLYAARQSRSVMFDKAGTVRILCNVHPSMEAYVIVLSHPYFSSVDVRGNYQIARVPLGKYRLQVWHPDSKGREVLFELSREGEVRVLDLDLKKQR